MVATSRIPTVPNTKSVNVSQPEVHTVIPKALENSIVPLCEISEDTTRRSSFSLVPPAPKALHPSTVHLSYSNKKTAEYLFSPSRTCFIPIARHGATL